MNKSKKQNSQIIIPPEGYRLLKSNETIMEDDIVEASWSHNGWNNGAGIEIGHKASEFDYRFARKRKA